MTFTVTGISVEVSAQLFVDAAKNVAVPALNAGVVNAVPVPRLKAAEGTLYQLMVPVPLAFNVTVPPLHTVMLFADVAFTGLAGAVHSSNCTRKASVAPPPKAGW